MAHFGGPKRWGPGLFMNFLFQSQIKAGNQECLSVFECSCWTTFVFRCMPGHGLWFTGQYSGYPFTSARGKRVHVPKHQGSGLMALGNSSFKLNLTSRVYGMKSDEWKLICYLSDIAVRLLISFYREDLFFISRYIPRGTNILCWKMIVPRSKNNSRVSQQSFSNNLMLLHC